MRAISESTNVCCPLCGEPTDRVHIGFRRILADMPWAGTAVHLQVQMRKSFCENLVCPRMDLRLGITSVSGHRTERQRATILAIAVALGGEAGARLAARLGKPVTPDMLLRLIRQAPEAEVPDRIPSQHRRPVPATLCVPSNRS